MSVWGCLRRVRVPVGVGWPLGGAATAQNLTDKARVAFWRAGTLIAVGSSLVKKAERRIATYLTGREAVLVLLTVQILEGNRVAVDGRCRTQALETRLG
jgi:hypothetical protein